MLDYEKLQKGFRQDAEELKTRPLPPELQPAAYGYWTGYPFFLEVMDAGLEDHDQPIPPAYFSARDALKYAHYQAAQALVGLAEQVHLDGGSIWTASRIFKDMFPETERVIPGVGGSLWPEGWGKRIDTLPADTRAVIRLGYETLVRLSERLGISVGSTKSGTASNSPSGQLKSQQSKRGPKKKPFTKRRADFAKPRAEKGELWPEIFRAYREEHAEDSHATVDKVRRAYEREFPAQ